MKTNASPNPFPDRGRPPTLDSSRFPRPSAQDFPPNGEDASNGFQGYNATNNATAGGKVASGTDGRTRRPAGQEPLPGED
jgi:hypothetical protein